MNSVGTDSSVDAKVDARRGTPSVPAARKPWNRDFWVPLALGILGFVLLVVAAGASMAGIGGGLLLLAASVYAGRVLARAHAAATDAAVQAAAQPTGRIRELCVQTLPVWRRQVDTTRNEADAAVAELARTFAAIAEKLEKVMRSGIRSDDSAPDGRDAVLDAIAHSGADLDGLVDALRSLQDSKTHIVRDVGAQAASLVENAAEVRGIAMQTRILTLNAAIEAARAGEAGAPFAVIVGDMRQLAARTAETSEKISKQTEILNAAVATAFRETDSGGSESATSIARAQEVIQGVVMSFQSMTDSLSSAIELMERERREVRDDISTALVSLQFQDRVSQILSHVAQSMDDLGERIAQENPGDGAVREWFDKMSSHYTTSEEFNNLSREPRGERAAGEKVTFF